MIKELWRQRICRPRFRAHAGISNAHQRERDSLSECTDITSVNKKETSSNSNSTDFWSNKSAASGIVAPLHRQAHLSSVSSSGKTGVSNPESSQQHSLDDDAIASPQQSLHPSWHRSGQLITIIASKIFKNRCMRGIKKDRVDFWNNTLDPLILQLRSRKA